MILTSMTARLLRGAVGASLLVACGCMTAGNTNMAGPAVPTPPLWQRILPWGEKPPANAASYAPAPVRIAEAPAPKKLKNPGRLNLAYGRWQEQIGQLSEARKSYDLALKDDPKSADAVLGLARLDLLAGRVREAEAGFQRAARMAPNDAEVLHSLGQYYASQERWSEAVRWLDGALNIARVDSSGAETTTIEYHLALAKARSGDVAGAFPHFANSIGEAEGHYNIGYILLEKGQKGAAEHHLELALRDRPDLHEAQALLDEMHGIVRAPAKDRAVMQTSHSTAQGMAAPRGFAGAPAPTAAPAPMAPNSFGAASPGNFTAAPGAALPNAPLSGARSAASPQRPEPAAVQPGGPSLGGIVPIGAGSAADLSGMSPQQQEQWRNQFSGNGAAR